MTILRIMDANLNRAREALRVMEEAARFILIDAGMSEELKGMRHALAQAAACLPSLLEVRDVEGDVGIGIENESERRRRDASDVVRAAAARFGEACRVLEEFGKTIDPAFARTAADLRYRGYVVEASLRARLPRRQAPQWRLCVLLSESLCAARSWEATLTAVASGAPDAVQIREKGMDDRALLAHIARARAVLPPGTAIIVNDRPDVALLSGADGVHLGQSDLPVHAARRIVGERLLIGVSTERIEEAKAARDAGADYCGIGPMYETQTKQKPRLAGPAYAAEFGAWGGLPHLAIGGVTLERLPELIGVGVRGVAVSRGICGADDPGMAVREFQRMLTPSLLAEPAAAAAP